MLIWKERRKVILLFLVIFLVLAMLGFWFDTSTH
jgi:hypothetical protein